MEKVSIVIPVYNAEKYLVECLESALNQTYKEIEIIAVDDGSTDNSLNILNKYSDKIKIISKENGGTASALNAGIHEATGQWIKQLDSDDILYPNAVEVLVSEARKIPDKTNTILDANWDIIDSTGKITGVHLEPNFNDLTNFDFNVILLDNHIGNSDTTLIHKSTFEKYGYLDGRFGHEDYEFRLRCCLLHNCRVYFIPKILAKYRVHQNSISWTSLRNTSERKKMIRKFTLDKMDPAERHKYELALDKYQKSRSIISRFLTYAGYNILPHLPKSISIKIVTMYLRANQGRLR